jgi:hypothetical protein
MQPSAPSNDFYQGPGVAAKAAEITVLNLLAGLVKEKVLTAGQALSIFDNNKLVDGINNAHQIGMTLRSSRDALNWMINEDTKSAGADR